MSKSVPPEAAAPLALLELDPAKLIQLKIRNFTNKKFWVVSKVSSHRGDHFDIWLWASNLKYMVRLTK